MVAKSFEVGDLVWAKMKGYPPWPGKIIDPPSNVKSPKAKKAHHHVFFFGYENHASIPDENIFLHNDRLVQKYAKNKKQGIYLSAIETIVDKSKNSTKYQKQHDSSFDKQESDDDSPNNSKLHETSFESVKDASPKNRSSLSNSVTKKDIKRKVPLKKTPVFKRVIKRPLSPDHSPESSGLLSSKAARMDEGKQEKGYKDLLTSLSSNISDMGVSFTENISTITNAGLLGRSYINRPKTPEIDLTCENKILKEKKIVPTTKKIGFLGLGGLGKGIVKNLLQSGHYVTIWNRTTAKCEEFVDIGAEKASTPSDVVSSSDITFCCVSDPDAAKKLVFENWGVLKGLELSGGGNKGFVEMTSMDHETSQTIGEQVKLKGGRYLEAPIHGSRVQAEEGTLFVLAAGDESLYNECLSCFQAMSKHHVYMRSTIGDASKLNVIHSMLVGTVYAAVAESLALLKRIELDPTDFLEILQYGVLDSKLIIQKATSMVNQMYVPNTRLRHIQRDLSLGLMMGSTAEQPMPITAAANEVYKHCKLLRFGDHDVSAIFEGIRGMLG